MQLKLETVESCDLFDCDSRIELCSLANLGVVREVWWEDGERDYITYYDSPAEAEQVYCEMVDHEIEELEKARARAKKRKEQAALWMKHTLPVLVWLYSQYELQYDMVHPQNRRVRVPYYQAWEVAHRSRYLEEILKDNEENQYKYVSSFQKYYVAGVTDMEQAIDALLRGDDYDTESVS